MKPYGLRICAPGSPDDPIEDFLSDRPFGAIAVGDLLNLEHFQQEMGARTLFRVIAVEHLLFEDEAAGVVHKIRVFTEHAPDTDESRLGSSGKADG